MSVKANGIDAQSSNKKRFGISAIGFYVHAQHSFLGWHAWGAHKLDDQLPSGEPLKFDGYFYNHQILTNMLGPTGVIGLTRLCLASIIFKS